MLLGLSSRILFWGIHFKAILDTLSVGFNKICYIHFHSLPSICMWMSSLLAGRTLKVFVGYGVWPEYSTYSAQALVYKSLKTLPGRFSMMPCCYKSKILVDFVISVCQIWSLLLLLLSSNSSFLANFTRSSVFPCKYRRHSPSMYLRCLWKPHDISLCCA